MSNSRVQRLYSPIVLDHSRSPRLATLPAHPTATAQGDNPLCGDSVELGLCIDERRLTDIGHRTRGCALCVAAASTMSEALVGASLEEADRINASFRRLINTGEFTPDLGALAAFAGITAFPMRRKCAVLAWDVLVAALSKCCD